jgi:peptidyl-prolyl cis-trans isomerase A (cyclophilin A)
MRRLVPLIALLLGCGPGRDDALFHPDLAQQSPPMTFRVRFETTKGDFLVDVYRDWSPLGARRFYNLVRIGFYKDCAFFRVVPSRAQFGYHGNPKVNAAWRSAFLPAEQPKQSNRRGFVAFDQGPSPGSRTTQVFINRLDNTDLDAAFPPIGQVVEGMDVIDRLFGGYGEGAPRGSGPAPSRIDYEGNKYLKREFADLDYIRRASIVE